MTVALALLLPLAVAMAAADAIAGEAASGTLRGLLLAPVGRLRLVGMKAFGVLVVAVAAVLALAVVGVLAGLIVVGGAGGQLVTLSGTTLGFGEALGRVALVAVWTVGQLAAVGAVALAVSAWTEHPLVVLAAVLGGLIVFGVLGAIPALDWLQPYLLTSGWSAGVDALRDPLPLAGMLGRDGAGALLPRRRCRAPRSRGCCAATPDAAQDERPCPHLLDDAAIDAALRTSPAGAARATRSCARPSCRRSPSRSAWWPGSAEIAEGRDHHPDIDIRWRTLTFRCSTHSEGGITQRDVDLAAAISEQVEAKA